MIQKNPLDQIGRRAKQIARYAHPGKQDKRSRSEQPSGEEEQQKSGKKNLYGVEGCVPEIGMYQ
jgi:hypothetical protein